MGACYRNRDKSLIKHECLRFEESPKPGTLVAIDAEFVSMQQVGSHSTRLVHILGSVFLFHRKKPSSGLRFDGENRVIHSPSSPQSCEGTAQKKTLRSLATTSMMSSLIFSTSSRVLNVRSHLPLRVTRGSPWHRT